jgi:DNA invertase Pin-like site-specific DNA recombinase
MAEFERELIRSRMAEGISRKRARGEHLGPEFKLSPEAQKAIMRRYASGEPMALLADEYGVGRATIYRVLDRARAAASLLSVSLSLASVIPAFSTRQAVACPRGRIDRTTLARQSVE